MPRSNGGRLKGPLSAACAKFVALELGEAEKSSSAPRVTSAKRMKERPVGAKSKSKTMKTKLKEFDKAAESVERVYMDWLGADDEEKFGNEFNSSSEAPAGWNEDSLLYPEDAIMPEIGDGSIIEPLDFILFNEDIVLNPIDPNSSRRRSSGATLEQWLDDVLAEGEARKADSKTP
jgi:hypothetical protein